MKDQDFTFKRLKAILKAIREETQPIEGHDDPKAITDCWFEVNDIINHLENKSKEFRYTPWYEK